MRQKNFFVTGPPGCGKSTVIEGVLYRLNRPVTGFFTREIREKGHRRGFKIVTLDRKEAVLAHDRLDGVLRVGKYGVNLAELERIAVPSMIPVAPDQIVVVDEIGKMECYSALFRDTLIRTLDSPNIVIGSVSQQARTFIQEIKSREDVRLFFVSPDNRDALPDALIRVIEGD